MDNRPGEGQPADTPGQDGHGTEADGPAGQTGIAGTDGQWPDPTPLL